MSEITLDDADRFDEALSQLRALIKDHPGNAQAHQNLAMFLLSYGQFEEGWSEYRWRLEIAEMKYKARYSMFPVPQWAGDSLDGKNVLVWLDQGIGDQILQASILPDLIAEAGHVTVSCHRRLVPLLARSLPSARFVAPTALREFDFDCQMSIGDLGARYRRTFGDFPQRSFLTAAPCRRYSAGLTVGVSWRSANFRLGGHKSISAEDLAPLFDVPGVTFVNLQYGEAQNLPPQVICDPAVDPLVDLDRFASQVAACDIVVTTSNTTLHVAGALGVRTVGLLPRGAGRYWYWFTGRQDCPWYPSVQLLRQATAGDWEPLVAAAAHLLRAETQERGREAGICIWSPEPKVDRDELARARLRIAELERAIEPLLPYADCDDFEFSAIFRRGPDELKPMQQALTKVMRETAYTDITEYKNLAKVMRNRWSDVA